jgi:D-lyxose ketol-isomerase
MLGLDITEYGMGNFAELGLALITIHNGNAHNK